MTAWVPMEHAEVAVELSSFERRPPPLPPVEEDDDPLRQILEAAKFSWRNKGKLTRSWHLIAIQFLPPFSSLVNRGWRLEVVRAGGDLVPTPTEIPKFAIQGTVLWAMYSLYLLPVMTYLFIDRFGWFFDLVGLCSYVLGVISSGNPTTGLGSFLSEAGMSFVVGSGFLLFYPIATWPFYRIAMIRYAFSNRKSVFFDFRNNWSVARRAYPLILHVYAQNKLLWVFATPVAALCTATGVGAFLVPGLLAPWRLVTSGLLYRNLAEKLVSRGLLDREGHILRVESADRVPSPMTSEANHSEERSWYRVDDRGLPARLDQPVQAILSRSDASPDAGGRTPDLFWTQGMWRWEGRPAAWSYFNRLQDRKPPSTSEENRRESEHRFAVLVRRALGDLDLGGIWSDFKSLTRSSNDGTGQAEEAWRSRATWIVVAQYLPVISSVINRGWRLDLMRSGAVRGFPSRRHLGRHLSEGLLLWAVYLVYLIPFFCLLVLTNFRWVEHLIEVAWWLLQLAFGEPSRSLSGIVGGSLVLFVLDTILHAAYPLLSWPIFRGAMIRYALEGDLAIFWQLRKNLRFSRVNLPILAGVYFAEKTLWLVYMLSSMLLLASGLGTILIPTLAPLRMAFSGLLYIRGLSKAPSTKGLFVSGNERIPTMLEP